MKVKLQKNEMNNRYLLTFFLLCLAFVTSFGQTELTITPNTEIEIKDFDINLSNNNGKSAIEFISPGANGLAKVKINGDQKEITFNNGNSFEVNTVLRTL